MPEDTIAPVLVTKGVFKEFAGVRVLHGVDLAVCKGEIHGIIGENGAGKSTLMKIIAGLYDATAGEIHLEGKKVAYANPAEAIADGVAMIHQELNLVDELTVADNIFLGQEKADHGFIRVDETESEAGVHLQQLQSRLDPGASLKTLSIAEKQIVEIAKAVRQNARVLIMDEPTAVLTLDQVEALFALMRDLKEQGITILYISHKLDEVMTICDRVSVLRDGHLVATREIGEVTAHDLANLMVGREIEDYYPERSQSTSDVALSVRNLRPAGQPAAVDFELRKGEILGMAGLVGAGRTEIAEAMVGLREKESGKLALKGQDVKIDRFEDAIANRIAYLSEDRKGKALVIPMGVCENTTLVTLERYCHPLIDREKEEAVTQEYVDQFQTKVHRLSDPVQTLSGGNQQKIAFSKWFEIHPEVLILDEPTRGIDVNAKREIYEIIKKEVEAGKACLVISSELPELLGLCHRILVVHHGEIRAELESARTSEEEIMQYATGIKEKTV